MSCAEVHLHPHTFQRWLVHPGVVSFTLIGDMIKVTFSRDIGLKDSRIIFKVSVILDIASTKECPM